MIDNGQFKVKQVQKINGQIAYINLSFDIDDYSIEDYQDMFNALVNEEIIYQSKYKNNVWKATDSLKDTLSTYDFSIKEYENEMKKFVLVLLNLCKLSHKTCFDYIEAIHYFYNLSDGFEKDKLKSISINPDKKVKTLAYRFMAFVSFCKLDNYLEIITDFNSISMEYNNSPRVLPMFYSVMVFDYLINDYFIDKNEENEFFPIYLWWKLSSILPLRPREFMMLKRDCLKVKQKNKQKHYFIHIERAKEKQSMLSKDIIPVVKDFEIPYEIWFLFNKYIRFANTIDNNQYMFSKKVFDSRTNTNSHRRERDYLGCRRFVQSMDRFYKSLEEAYCISVIKKGELDSYDGKEIEKINMGDTRHIAICDLMLQGVNPIKIAQMAGHKKLETQMEYCSHYSDYITSKTKVLQEVLTGNIKLRNNQISFCNDKKTSILQKEMLGTAYYSLPKVDGGRCTSKILYNECPLDGCYFCPKLIPDNSMDVDRLKQYEENLDKEINNKLEYLKSIVSNSIYNNIQEIQSKELELGSIFNQKIWIESYRYLKENNKLEDDSKLLTGGN